eukprot:jgi/Botrbrau1/10201/Bobra.116_1s0017.1
MVLATFTVGVEEALAAFRPAASPRAPHNRVEPLQIAETWHKYLEAARSSPEGRKKLEKTEKGEYAMFLFKCIVALSGHLMACSIGLQLVYAAFQLTGPILLNRIVTFLQSSSTSNGVQGGIKEGERVWICSGNAAVSGFEPSSLPRSTAKLSASVPVRGKKTEVGRIVNLMSNDVNTIMTFFYPFANQLFSAPIMLVTALILLFFQISWATLIGLLILLLSTPASGRFVRKLTQLRRDMLKHTDQRIKLTNQLLVGIRVLKIYAWEAAQEAAVSEARVKELGRLGAAIPARVGMQTLLFAAPVLAAVCSFAVYGAVSPNNFTAARIFSSIALFGIMRIPLVLLPFALVELGNAFVSLRRLSQYLVMEEREEVVEKLPEVGVQVKGASFYWPHMEKLVFAQAPPPNQGLLGWALMLLKRKKNNNSSSSSSGGGGGGEGQAAKGGTKGLTESTVPLTVVEPVANPAKLKEDDGGMEDASSLERSSSSLGTDLKPAEEAPSGGSGDRGGGMRGDATWWLSDINLQVNEGDLVCVVGRVGSGKSSLVNAILGEMCFESGRVAVGGRVAYVAQQAWIVNDTLKNNVLFGSPLDQERWQSTIEACSLISDLAVLPGGEGTEIGEKGINLSGGQKQRISLARAVYADAELYIMDDPLSAVDVHVGRHIFDFCIQGVLRNKTRLLVTNQLQYLGAATHVVYLENGCIAAQGSLEEVQRHPGFAALQADFNAKSGAELEEEEAGEAADLAPALLPMSPCQPGLRSSGDNAIAEARRGRAQELLSLPTFVSALPRQETGQATIQGGEEQSEAPEPSPRQRGIARIPTLDIEHGVEVEAANIAGAAGGAFGRSAPAALEKAFQDYAGAAAASSPNEDENSSPPATPRRREERSLGTDIIDFVVGRPSGEGEAGAEGTPSPRWIWHAELLPTPPSLSAGCQSARRDGQPRSHLGQLPQGKETKNAGLVVSEDREVGSIGYGVYIAYIRMYGLFFAQLLLLLWASEQTTRVLTNWWLSRWTGAQAAYDLSVRLGLPTGAEPKQRYLGGYLGLSLAFVALVALRSTTNLTSALRASRHMHHRSLHHVVRAPVSFFDTTPIGRILNRFSKDMDDIDYLLPQSLNDFGNCLMQLLATLIFISVIQPWFLAGMIPLMFIYFGIQKFYRRSYVELQRTDAVTRSPMYAHFSETLTGVDSIRAYGVAQRFALRSDQQGFEYDNLEGEVQSLLLSEDSGPVAELAPGCDRASLSFTTAILAVANRRNIPTSLAAVTLSEVLDVTGFLKFAVQMAAMFESRFNSVERLLTYQNLPQEAALIIPDNRPPEDWPPRGELSFSDVWMRYRPDLDPVLKGVSFKVEPREKIGIVGRTGQRQKQPHRGPLPHGGALPRPDCVGWNRSAVLGPSGRARPHCRHSPGSRTV